MGGRSVLNLGTGGRGCLAASDRVVAAKTSLSEYFTAKVDR